MTEQTKPQQHIFLVQPLRKNLYKEVIVYADNEQDARAAAARVKHPEKVQQANAAFSNATIYQDKGMSICIEINPKITKEDANSNTVQVEYNEVVYDLEKSVAQLVIAEESI